MKKGLMFGMLIILGSSSVYGGVSEVWEKGVSEVWEKLVGASRSETVDDMPNDIELSMQVLDVEDELDSVQGVQSPVVLQDDSESLFDESFQEIQLDNVGEKTATKQEGVAEELVRALRKLDVKVMCTKDKKVLLSELEFGKKIRPNNVRSVNKCKKRWEKHLGHLSLTPVMVSYLEGLARSTESKEKKKPSCELVEARKALVGQLKANK